MDEFSQNQPSMNSVEQQVLDQTQAQQQSNEQPKQGESAEYEQIASMISDLDRRLRVLEERYSNIRKKLQLTDENMVEAERSFIKEVRSLSEDQMGVKRNLNDFEDKILEFGDELKTTAKKVDLKVIERYLSLWNPTMFVTREELREYLKSKGILKKPDDELRNQ